MAPDNYTYLKPLLSFLLYSLELDEFLEPQEIPSPIKTRKGQCNMVTDKVFIIVIQGRMIAKVYVPTVSSNEGRYRSVVENI